MICGMEIKELVQGKISLRFIQKPREGNPLKKVN